MQYSPRTRFWSPMLAIVLLPALLQEDCKVPPTYDLSTFEVEAAGLDRVVAFDPSQSTYDIWTTAGVDTIVVRAVAFSSIAELGYALSFGGQVTTGELGTGRGEVTLNIPVDTPGELEVGVKVGGIRRLYKVAINPSCDMATCDDANACTSDACNGTTCEFAALPNGTSCSIALSDCSEGAAPGVGACDSGLCAASLELCPCDTETAYQAVPKECASGAVWDPGSTTCTCDELGADVPHGGSCAEFGPPVVAGCEMAGGVLGTQLSFTVWIWFGVTSPGSLGPGTVDHRARMRVENPFFNTAGSIELLDTADIVIASDPPGTPATLVNSLDPTRVGDQLATFYTFAPTGNFVELDTEILPATTTFEPAPGESVDFYLDDLVFELRIIPSDTILRFDKSNCTFDNPGTVIEPGLPPADGSPISCPVTVSP